MKKTSLKTKTVKAKTVKAKTVKAKTVKNTTPVKKENSSLIGKYVIVRSHMAGVFFGVLAKKKNTELTLNNVRKLYYFAGANTVEDLAEQGALNIEKCKFTKTVSQIIISDFVQILPCKKESILNIKSIPEWTFKNK